MNKDNHTWHCWRRLIDSEDAKGLEQEAEAAPPGPLYYAVKLQLADLASFFEDEHERDGAVNVLASGP